MWMKTGAHRLAKWVPTSAEYMREQLRAVRDVAAERDSARLGFVQAPSQPMAEDDFRVMADEAETLDELSTALGTARAAGYAQPGDELFQYFVDRRTRIEQGEVVEGHAHEGAYDADCDACTAEQSAADRKLAGVAP
jgi:hypothetical protein